MTWTYWRRWGGNPLRVVATYRSDPSGPVQTLVGEEWIAVPGDSVTRMIALGDTMLDRLSAAEVAELGIDPQPAASRSRIVREPPR